jgi:hypothetical protein
LHLQNGVAPFATSGDGLRNFPFRMPTSLVAGEMDMADEGLPDAELAPTWQTMMSESWGKNRTVHFHFSEENTC